MANPRSYPAKGPSQRQLRVGELIRRTLSEILARGEIHDVALNAMSITVGEVSVSVDLKVATVHVMPLMGGATVEAAIAYLDTPLRVIIELVPEKVIRFDGDKIAKASHEGTVPVAPD